MELSGNVATHTEQVFAWDLPSLMELLAQWTLALQSTSVAHLLAALPTEDPEQLTRLISRR